MRAAASQRIIDAVALLAPRPGEQLLEIGCGPGHAAALVVDALEGGRLVAIDRSDHAIALAARRNRDAVAADRVTLRHADICDGPVMPGGFDRVFAIRVNSFWTEPGKALANIAPSLRPGGTLLIIYDAPAAKIDAPIRRSLGEAGFTDLSTRRHGQAFAYIARWPGAVA